jgi:hypothetical protein
MAQWSLDNNVDIVVKCQKDIMSNEYGNDIDVMTRHNEG